MTTTMQGGYRDRMILESVHRQLADYLSGLGWLDSGRSHAPVKIVQGFPDEKVQVEPNTIAITLEDIYGELQELGSLLEESHMSIFMDMFCDSEAVSLHLAGDVYNFWKSMKALPVFDYSYEGESGWEASFHITIDHEMVSNRRSMRPTNPWQRHWRVVEVVFNDMRENDNG